jgi:two-component system KDP operon response regulator KdpE
MSVTVLLIDDDVDMCDLMKMALTPYDMRVEVAHDGLAGVQQVYRTQPDVILLDIMMPNLDGWETCRRIREMSDVPIIILSALNRQDAIIRGLNIGADDFICKPIVPETVVARINAVVRRTAKADAFNLPVVKQDNVIVDLFKYEVKVDGNRVRLSRTEFKLLAALVKRKGRVLSHQQLLKEVWGGEYIGEIDQLRLYISYLRRKLERDPASPRLIQTEWNVGYRFG